MQLDRRVWYVRLFFWCLDILNEAWDYRSYNFDRSTNLCHYMRVILVYTPLTLLAEAICYTVTLGSVTALPIYLFGWKGYLGFIFAGLVLFVIFSIFSKVLAFFRRRQGRYRASDSHEHVRFTWLFFAWVVAQKRKICPLITFSQNSSTELTTHEESQ